ncbi:uncharacterized protein HKW66_Vig0174100 [Vigna angularis]|uniref:Transmembrane protein n=1 Tax=Phaseolus angularis TaxID=3914 RepID=A0A8T0JNM2_PHAAN|nr:uncharacterized protein HKW66_Vig0174100 [Vigna angularis]
MMHEEASCTMHGGTLFLHFWLVQFVGVNWVSRCRDCDFLVHIWVGISSLQVRDFDSVLARWSVLMVVTAAWWPEGLVVACFVLWQWRWLGFHGGGTRVLSL